MASSKAQSSAAQKKAEEEDEIGSMINEADLEMPSDEDDPERDSGEETAAATQEGFHAPAQASADAQELPIHKVNERELKKWFEPGLHTIHIQMLRWDTKQVWGQIGRLDT